MDMRQYDPAIARWVVQDPVTHFDYSPYSAFDNNPIFFADPSGAESCSTCDSFGRQTIENGRYISVSERQERAKNDGSNNQKETWSQKTFRESITFFITELDNQNKGGLSEKKSDANVDAYELFYQWIMGKGSSTRNFDQNSTMGQQMLQAPEVLAAIDKVASNGVDRPFNRSLRTENPLLYIKSFYEDADGKNPARGFHGSFAGKVTVDSVIRNGNIVTTNMTIIMTDNMTATSGTRASGTAGGYKANNPLAIYPKENPYGPNGQFRTITINYNMKISVTKKINE